MKPTWDLYYLLVDDTWTFYRMDPPYGAQNRDASETHGYMMIDALKRGWIVVRPEAEWGDGVSRAQVNPDTFSSQARMVWDEFWKLFDPAGHLPRGRAAELEGEFFRLTGTTPIDLDVNADELGGFLEKGYRVEQLLTR